MIAIIDYGVGNLASIKNMLHKINVEAIVTSDTSEIIKAERYILPGVGAFDTCAIKLRSSGLLEVLEQQVHGLQKPVLGICVGLQLLFSGSEEGQEKGLSWIEGKVIRFQSSQMPVDLKIPHMGWTDVVVNKLHPLVHQLEQDSRYYFVHSYHPQVYNQDDILFTARYGYSFSAGICRNHIAGVQFHPEKSHRFGMQLLSNFAQWQPSVVFA